VTASGSPRTDRYTATTTAELRIALARRDAEVQQLQVALAKAVAAQPPPQPRRPPEAEPPQPAKQVTLNPKRVPHPLVCLVQSQASWRLTQ
jgi:hypothetical protein